jgi:hypothetical protein
VENDSNNQADTRVLQAVHNTFRTATTRLVDATSTLEPQALAKAIGPYWDFYYAILEYHHHNEDHHDFPVLAGYYPDIAEVVAELGKDHLQMVAILEELEKAVRAFEKAPDVAGRDRINAGAIQLRDLFFPHLDREDADVLPMYRKWIPPKEWAAMDTRALKGIPKPQVGNAIGALDETIQSLPEAERPLPPPLPVRVLLALAWRKKWAALVGPLSA